MAGKTPHVGPGFELTPLNHELIVQNLLKRTRRFSPSTIEAGMDWYPSAQKDARVVGGGNRDIGGAIIARLSGTRDYQRNRQMALQAMDLPSDQTKALFAAMDAGAEEHKAIRAEILGGTPLNDQTTGNIRSAINVRDKVITPDEAFNRKGNGSKKLGDFFIAVRSGGQEQEFPIDTHAYDAALDNHHIKYGIGNEHMKKAHVYPFIQSAYKEAYTRSQAEGTIPSDMTLAGYQATHWLHQQLGKAQVNSRSRARMIQGSTQAQATAEKFPSLNPEAHGMDPIPTVESIVTKMDHFATGMGEGRR